MRFVGEYLTKVDGATMHYALEARSPFLDQDLWEFAASLPYELRLHRGNLKALLRELAHRRINDRVARGRKRGFGVPVQRWIAGRWRPIVEETLRESLLEKEGWIRAASVLAQLEKASRRGWASKQLWYIFVLESWLKAERREQLHADTGSIEKLIVNNTTTVHTSSAGTADALALAVDEGKPQTAL
jgi:asparagine synthase (glutamine-hydrolysing)